MIFVKFNILEFNVTQFNYSCAITDCELIASKPSKLIITFSLKMDKKMSEGSLQSYSSSLIKTSISLA